jgi:hypothetical protein
MHWPQVTSRPASFYVAMSLAIGARLMPKTSKPMKALFFMALTGKLKGSERPATGPDLMVGTVFAIVLVERLNACITALCFMLV